MEKFGYGVISECRFRVTDVALWVKMAADVSYGGFWVANAWYDSFASSLAMARSRAPRFKLMSIRRHHQKDPPRRILRKLPKTRCVAAAPDRRAARIASNQPGRNAHRHHALEYPA
jgi:hypothetical protein